MAQLGKTNTLRIRRKTDFGLYLADDDGNEILLPNRYVTADMHTGDNIDVFVYKDSEDRIVATTETPKAQVGEFALLKVVATNSAGAFLDWGLPKDLLVPFREQKTDMVVGRYYIVYVYVDYNSDRIVASAKINKFLDNCPVKYHQGDPVDIMIAQRTDIGYKVIIDNLFSGIIYHNEIFRPVNIGDRLEAFIKTIREDGKIDVTLADRADRRTPELADKILMYLMSHGRRMTLTDKSSPEAIKSAFECSKKDFKKAIGYLYKKKIIALNPGEILML